MDAGGNTTTDTNPRGEADSQQDMVSHLSRILEHSRDEIYTFDAQTLRFREISPGASRNLGYTVEELRQMTPLDIKVELTRTYFEAMLAPLRRGEQSHITFETTHRRKDGTVYPVEVRLFHSGTETPPVFVAIIQDISERKRYLAELQRRALYDDLTGLPNRTLLDDRIRQTIRSARRSATPFVVCICDISHLRDINDILGHKNGDIVLKEVARRLQSTLRESDTMARLAGDEFAIVLPLSQARDISLIAGKLQNIFSNSVIIDDIPLEIEIAIGMAIYPDHGESVELLLQHADIAMRVAKNEINGLTIYDPANDPTSARHLRLLGELRNAVNDGALILHYQPKMEMKTGKITGVEALARWPHPSDGMISPADFIPMVEKTGLIHPFTMQTLRAAAQQCRQWQNIGLDLKVAVNLSVRNLLDPTLPKRLAALLEETSADPGMLILEITETVVMSHPERATNVLRSLSDMGIGISIDDFGTGHSSLAYLTRLPVEELKIDRSFVKGMVNDDRNCLIVRSTIDLAHNLGLRVVAEGVESNDIYQRLADYGCDLAQGYHIGHPMSATQITDLLAAH